MMQTGETRLRRIMGGAAALLLLGAGGTALAAMPGAAHPAGQAPHYVQVAGLFGESDEEKAAREQREQAQDSSIANLTQRVSDLEHALRQATGQIEDANHRNLVLQQKIDRMQKDFDYRLCQLSAQQLGSASEDNEQGGLNCAAPAASGGTPSDQQQGAMAPPAGGEQMGRPSGVLGTLPAGAPVPQAHPNVSVNMSAVGGAPPAAPAASASRSQFDSAMNLLAKAQYDEARGAFRSFADTYPKDDLAPQAVYWVGSIAYVQKDYPGAARAFAEEIKNYPDSPRAPESMLKLGQSLIAMKQKREGCTTLGALTSKYPKATKTVRREAEKARREAECR